MFVFWVVFVRLIYLARNQRTPYSRTIERNFWIGVWIMDLSTSKYSWAIWWMVLFLLVCIYYLLNLNWITYLVDYLSRDKVGLPRLMEALQSTMWSTMVRHATANHSLRKVPLGSAAIETQHGKDVDSIGDTTAADTNAVNDKIDSNNFEDTTQDDEDLNFFDAFASALAEVFEVLTLLYYISSYN